MFQFDISPKHLATTSRILNSFRSRLIRIRSLDFLGLEGANYATPIQSVIEMDVDSPATLLSLRRDEIRIICAKLSNMDLIALSVTCTQLRTFVSQLWKKRGKLLFGELLRNRRGTHGKGAAKKHREYLDRLLVSHRGMQGLVSHHALAHRLAEGWEREERAALVSMFRSHLEESKVLVLNSLM